MVAGIARRRGRLAVCLGQVWLGPVSSFEALTWTRGAIYEARPAIGRRGRCAGFVEVRLRTHLTVIIAVIR